MITNLMDVLLEYEKVIGESFPTFNFKHLPTSDIVKIITECIENKISVYDSKYKDVVNEDVEY